MQQVTGRSYQHRLLGGFLSIAAVIVLAAALLLTPGQPTTSTVCACTPPPGGVPHYSVAERTNAADVVIDGEVIAVEGNWILTATVRVNRYFKSSGPETVTIDHFGPESLCLSSVRVGDRWIFFTDGNPNEILHAQYMGQGDAIVPVTPEIVNQVIAAVCHEMAEPCTHRIYMPLFAVAE